MFASRKRKKKPLMKNYLFYEKITIRDSWKKDVYRKKFISYCVIALLTLCFFVACTLYSLNRLYAGLLFGTVWLFLFFGIPFIGYAVSQSYWIVLEKSYVLLHGSFNKHIAKKKIFYEEVGYIIIGNVEPCIAPRGTIGEYYHKKFGDYINALSPQKDVLFTVRFSEETFEFLQKKCINAKIINQL